MPSTITHAYIGLDTLNKLNDKPRKIIMENINNYKIYCQSMDVLYFYHIFLLLDNKVMKLGHLFHTEKVFDAFNLLINDNKENQDKELFTFIAGLITHYKADSITHPYINYLSHNSNNTLNAHFEIETYIDSYYVREKTDINYQKDNNSKTIFNYTEKEIIKSELNKLFFKLFNYSNIGNKYYRALKEMKFTYNYVRYDKYGIKKILYQIIDLNPIKSNRKTKYLSYHFNLNNDEYYLNLNHKKWYNIDNNNLVSTKSFLDLYEDIISEASYIINELYDYIYNDKNTDLKKLIKNISYANGLPISPNK